MIASFYRIGQKHTKDIRIRSLCSVMWKPAQVKGLKGPRQRDWTNRQENPDTSQEHTTKTMYANFLQVVSLDGHGSFVWEVKYFIAIVYGRFILTTVNYRS